MRSQSIRKRMGRWRFWAYLNLRMLRKIW